MTRSKKVIKKKEGRSYEALKSILVWGKEVCTYRLKKYYFKWYPLNDNLGKALLGRRYEIPPEEVERINEIRLKNVIATLLSQTGSLFALVITLFFGFASVSFPGKILEKVLDFINIWIGKHFGFLFDSPPFSNEIIASFLFFVASIWAFFLLSPLILRKVINHLSPEEYTKITIGSLTHGELLTFLAYKNWGLIENFLKVLELDQSGPVKWWEMKKEILEEGTSVKDQITKINEYIGKIDTYLDIHFKDIQHCIFLVRGSYDRLGINKRELTNHVLKFSPAMFYENLNAVLRSLETLRYFNDRDENDSVYDYYVRDFCYLVADLSSKRKQLLEELILFNDIHRYIIGMSSHTSTSLSLKVFIRGISEISSDYYATTGGEENEERDSIYIKKLKSILHRSKAHCGVDLLISLESFERNYLLNQTTRDLGADHSALISNRLRSIRINDPDTDLTSNGVKEIAACLKDIRKEYRDKIHHTQQVIIFKEFKKVVDEVIGAMTQKGVKAYFIVFGYSELIRQCLRSVAASLNANEISIFIIQDQELKSLDTRTFLYELKKNFQIEEEKCSMVEKSDSSSEPVRKSFTGKDIFIKTLVNQNDLVYFLAGAEVYDQKNKKLLHTNRYQERIEKLIGLFKKKEIVLQMCVIAEKYKVYNDYPGKKSVFGEQFYQDYYETLDMYDLKDLFLVSNIHLISDYGSEPNAKG